MFKVTFVVYLVYISGINGKIYLTDQSSDESIFDYDETDPSTSAPPSSTRQTTTCKTSPPRPTTEPVEATTESIEGVDVKGCGWINDTTQWIQNGSVVTKYRKLPWQVSIYKVLIGRNGKEIEINEFCAGTLIHPRVVLTQPQFHDISYINKLRIKAGEWNLPHETYVPQSSGVESVAKIVTRWFSVNLLFLTKAIQRSSNVNYACLPSPNIATEIPTNCLLESDHNYMGVALQKPTKMLEVSTMDLEDCRRRIRESQPLWRDVPFNSSWICVSNIEGQQNPCEGGDGTPLVCPYKDTPGRFYHAGVMSWYSSCYFGEGYGIFKTVSHARQLIDEKVREKGYRTEWYTL